LKPGKLVSLSARVCDAVTKQTRKDSKTQNQRQIRIYPQLRNVQLHKFETDILQKQEALAKFVSRSRISNTMIQPFIFLNEGVYPSLRDEKQSEWGLEDLNCPWVRDKNPL